MPDNLPTLPDTDLQQENTLLRKRIALLEEQLTDIVQDIRNRSDNEERYKHAVEAANIGIWDWDLDTNEIYLAPNLKALIGYADDEIANNLDAWSRHVHPDDREKVMVAAQAHIRGDTPLYEVEHRMLHRNGTIRWVIVRGIVVHDAYGKPVRMLGTDTDITEQVWAQEAYRTLVEHSLQGLVIFQNGRYAYANPMMHTITGYTVAELLDMSTEEISLLIHPADRSMVFGNVRKRMEGMPVPNRYECRIIHKRGDVRWVEIYATLTQYRGHPAAQTAFIDITERKHAEEALKQSEERYRSIITTMHEGVILHDRDGAIREWNARSKDMLGRTTETLLGHSNVASPWRAIREDGTPFAGLNHPSLVALRTGRPCSNVVMGIYKPDGELTWVLANAQPVFHDDSPSPAGVVATFTDITALKQTEQALRESEQRLRSAFNDLERLNEQLSRNRDLLRTLFDGLPDGLVLLDHHGSILAVNQAIATLFGMEPDQLLHHSWSSLCRKTSPPFPGDVVVHTFKDGTAHRQRERYTGHSHRSPRVLDIQTLPIKGPDHVLEQVVIHVVDVTEQVTLETIAIQHERLAASGALAATIAHEVNTPLQSVNHCLFLAYDVDDPQRDTYLTMAREEIARISTIVRQLLDLHRPPSSSPAFFAVTPLITRVLTLMGSTLKNHNITVKQELAHDLPRLWGHADQITQVLMNLILNAKKAMPDGGQLWVRTLLRRGAYTPGQQPSGWHVVIQVEDTGVGINPDIQERIFESFFTTDSEGLGLGLTISQKIMMQHNGYISVRSKPGVGSVFDVVFPLTPDAHAETESS
jgi:hypothetical protein